MSRDSCHDYRFWSVSCGTFIQIRLNSAFFSTVVLSARVWALYGRTKIFLALLLACWLLCILTPFFIMGPSMKVSIRTSQTNFFLFLRLAQIRNLYQGCYFGVYPKKFYIMYLGSFAYESEWLKLTMSLPIS